MATNENLIPIPGRLHSVATEGHVAGADEIYDDTLQKTQEQVNAAKADLVDGKVPTSQLPEIDNFPDQTGQSGKFLKTNGSVVSWDNVPNPTIDQTYNASSANAQSGTAVAGAISGKANTSDVNTALAGKQDTISDLSTIRSGAALGATAQQPATTLAGYGITDAYTKSETYTKTEVNGLVDTPHQEYVTVDAYANLPATGSKDTIYRVSNYNGSTSQVDASVYSEYAWDGSQYVFLCVKSQIGEVFDISVYNNNAKYADLAAALNGGANIPQSLQKGGMSIKFVQSSDNKYVQFRLKLKSFSNNTIYWEPYNIIDVNNNYESDLGISDEYNNVLVSFQSGHIKTKNFDSSNIEPGAQVNDVNTDNTEDADLNIIDNNENILMQLKDGHIKTKKFDSRNVTPNPLKGKTISIFGDSISTYTGYIPTGNATFFPSGEVDSVEKTWWYSLIHELQLNLLINQSWSGSRVADGSSFGRTEISFSDERRYSTLQSPNIILIFGGVNDCSSQANPNPLGEFLENTNDTFNTLYTAQAFQKLCIKCTELYPYSDIFFMAPLNNQHVFWKNTQGWGHKELRDLLIKISKYYGVKLIETYKCGLNNYTKNLFTLDGLHPNVQGHQLIKNFVKKELINYYK